MMQEKDILKIAAAAVLFIVGSILIIEQKLNPDETKAASKKPAAPSVVAAPVKSIIKKAEGVIENKTLAIGGEFCKNVLVSCTSELSNATETCNKFNDIASVREKLVEPLKFGDCKEVSGQLSALCPEGCRLDETKLMVLPGDPDIYFNEERNEEGFCETKGEVFVNVRGTCVY